MDKFECSCICSNEECSRFHNPAQQPCHCIRQLGKSTKFIERMLDCTHTVVRVLSICGIHECKAKSAAEVIAYAFLHYDIVPDPVSDVLRKKLRKEDVFHDLGRKCRMNRVEAHLAYSIIKRAFKAFYFKQCADMYNPDFVDELQWMRAAQRSAEVYATSEGLTENERKALEGRIKCAYCSYIERVQEAHRKEMEKSCTCCFCSKCKSFGGEKGFKVYATALPKEDEETYQFKKRMIAEGRLFAKAPPDPCGTKLLEWQTQAKSKCNRPCQCGGDPCFCQHDQLNEGECCRPVTECVAPTDGIAVAWQCTTTEAETPAAQ